VTVDLFFASLNPPEVAYLACSWPASFARSPGCSDRPSPSSPICCSIERVGEASGEALYYSTLGSFLGSLLLSLLVMQWLGVSAAVALTVRCC
jgi:hypothetical protein